MDRVQLHRDGCTLLRGAIAAEWLAELRTAFDTGVKPSLEWSVPRQVSWRHSLLDLDPKVQAVCRLPSLLSDADLLHAGSTNPTGARRRSILICYFAEVLYGSHLETAKLRSIRMDTSDRFSPLGTLGTFKPS